MRLAASITWANYNRQSRVLSATIPGLEIAANSMWMSGAWLLPMGLIEVAAHGITVDAPHLGVQAFCIFFGGVVPYAFWNSALRHWRTSQVMLFNNFHPPDDHCVGVFSFERTHHHTFCAAMILIVTGVAIGQADWAKF